MAFRTSTPIEHYQQKLVDSLFVNTATTNRQFIASLHNLFLRISLRKLLSALPTEIETSIRRMVTETPVVNFLKIQHYLWSKENDRSFCIRAHIN